MKLKEELKYFATPWRLICKTDLHNGYDNLDDD